MGRARRWLKKLLGGKEDSSREAKQNGFTGELRMEKKRWSFKSESRLPATSAWFSQNEEKKHAIAVAEATAATADAAVAAAQAAVGVVCLASNGKGNANTVAVAGEWQWLAAVKIQSLFRAYLAKKALRALKALVKLQALVKGYLVRKQAAATLRSIQALIRAQAIVRAQKSHVIPEVRQRVHLERFEESRRERVASFRRRRLSVNLNCMNNGYYDRSPKMVEVDAYCRLKSRSSRSTLMDTTEEDITLNSFSSLLPCQMPAKISTPQSRSFQDCDWSLTNDKYLYSSTAQTTPRYVNSTSNGTVPAKSVSAADGVFRGPSYMAKTRSFEAKVRSQSAPKQRPEPAGLRKMLPLSGELIDP